MMDILRTLVLAASLALALAHGSRAADFNADGRQDLVWRTHDGNPRIWQMSGLAVASRFTLAVAPDASAAIVGAGTFAATAGILWLDSSDRLSLWRVADGILQQACVLADGIDPAWVFLGVGDVDGDGSDDVLWRLPDGSVRADLVNGCNAPVPLTLGAAAPSTWTFVGIGTIDAHGGGAIFWRDATGDVVVWRLHNGAAVLATTLRANEYATWTIAAIADLDGNGASDVLWRDPGGTLAAVWLMSGTKAAAGTLAPVGTSVFAAHDDLFAGTFDSNAAPAPVLDASWTMLGASDVNGDGRADIVLANARGDVAIWQMDGAAVQATGLIAAADDMPYTGLTGWRMMMDRPAITKVDDRVTVSWAALDGPQRYVAYASATNDPAQTGVALAADAPDIAFGRDDPGYGDKRYFAVGAEYLGIRLPPSPEAYVVEFERSRLPDYGPMAVADIDGDGCIEILGVLGDCHGNFRLFDESAMGLGALRAADRADRDLRFADLDGDGRLDLISNVYAPIDAGASQVLFYRGIGDGQFAVDADFSNLGIRGFGETIVIADFNNDGFLDIFLPQYSFNSPDEHSWLLLNDGSGHFTDVADVAGVALRNVPACGRPEGAQAVDLDGDGRIDLYAASHMFMNNSAGAGSTPAFVDLGPVVDEQCAVIAPSAAGLPQFFDEGAKFIDLDNSGRLALALNGESTPPGIAVLEFDGLAHFSDVTTLTDVSLSDAWGFNATDVDGDGLTDLVVGGGCDSSFFAGDETNPSCTDAGSPHALPQLLVNRGGRFVRHDFYRDGLDPTERGWNDLVTWADFDGSGTADFVTRTAGGIDSGFTVLRNEALSTDVVTVSVVAADGARNQAGRVVRVTPLARPGTVMTQVVDGGSGYMANGPYDLSFAAAYPGAYRVSVRFANATYTATAQRGDHITLRADGSYSRP